jgi:hypothetical protein
MRQNIIAVGACRRGSLSPCGGQEPVSRKGPGTRYNVQSHILRDLLPQARPYFLQFPKTPKIALPAGGYEFNI